MHYFRVNNQVQLTTKSEIFLFIRLGSVSKIKGVTSKIHLLITPYKLITTRKRDASTANTSTIRIFKHTVLLHYLDSRTERLHHRLGLTI